MQSKGRWQIVINGKPDPRRFKSYKQFSEAIKADVLAGRITEEAQIRVRIIKPEHYVSPGATLLWCLRGAYHEYLRHVNS